MSSCAISMVTNDISRVDSHNAGYKYTELELQASFVSAATIREFRVAVNAI